MRMQSGFTARLESGIGEIDEISQSRKSLAATLFAEGLGINNQLMFPQSGKTAEWQMISMKYFHFVTHSLCAVFESYLYVLRVVL